ncbi:TIGR01621 family pseudouridine synthase [Saccharobesus litoralis]|uniref:TIGR01621 family pseudouridine synthase n=1 Tax=Saccharobesus litoralis TaxID=2172099 RepID=A0A2S0VXV9_9ALTE|nr:TIGR01621 family pseudouridine synthase [Saccharobesus litoralis]AWB69033.1 TIGR01621 family pseudouridine synthase [Saccharobesus litoralis]
MSLVYQNEHFVIAYKPENVDFHDDSQNGNQGFFNQTKHELQLTELYPCHRLDKVTSGLIIFAKTLNAEHAFNELFKNKNIQKIYLAISDRKPSKKQGKVAGDMEKSRNSAWRLSRSQMNPAITHFNSIALTEGKRLFVLKPATGKTHQLRVMMKSLGSPICGDQLYKGTEVDRVYLHAYQLKFSLFGEDYTFSQFPNSGSWFLSLAKQTNLKSLIHEKIELLAAKA